MRFFWKTLTFFRRHPECEDAPHEPSRQSSPSPKLSAFSEYENLDYDDESSQDDEDGSSTPTTIHSDFGKIQALPERVLSLEAYSFDNPSSLGTEDVYTFDPGGNALGLILENERKVEVSHAPCMGRIVV